MEWAAAWVEWAAAWAEEWAATRTTQLSEHKLSVDSHLLSDVPKHTAGIPCLTLSCCPLLQQKHWTCGTWICLVDKSSVLDDRHVGTAVGVQQRMWLRLLYLCIPFAAFSVRFSVLITSVP